MYKKEKHTSDPFLKERTAERTFTAMQRMPTRAVTKLKHLHTTKKGSGPALILELDDNPGPASPSPPPSPSFLAICFRKLRKLKESAASIEEFCVI